VNILFLSTFPIGNASHGGQVRIKNLIAKYRQLGHRVQSAGVLGGDHYKPEAGFVAMPVRSDLDSCCGQSWLMEDYAIGRLFGEQAKYFESLASQIDPVPDLIHVEHPWLVAFACRFISQSAKPTKLVYGSANVEWELKLRILGNYRSRSDAQQAAALVREVEEAAIFAADVVLCVSYSDKSWIERLRSGPTLYVPNGVDRRLVDETDRRDFAKAHRGLPFAVYCGSAHPPNVEGFFDMVGKAFGPLNQGQRLATVGSVGDAIASDERVLQVATLAKRLINFGVVSEARLATILDCASCVILPITHGGGTNLKTAEAIWSGKHVIATDVAMRGFEEYIGSAGIHVASDAVEFRNLIRECMTMADPVLSSADREHRLRVLWEYSLQSVAQIFEPTASGGTL
jgi:glycosyltransferase involved in cell wall biosynthesis